jgi:hypothetical protein
MMTMTEEKKNQKKKREHVAYSHVLGEEKKN